MNLHDPAAWLGLTIIACIVGSYAVWWFTSREAARTEQQEQWWRETMTPNRDGHLADHVPPDTLTERPLLPENYQDWNSKR